MNNYEKKKKNVLASLVYYMVWWEFIVIKYRDKFTAVNVLHTRWNEYEDLIYKSWLIWNNIKK